MYDDDEIRSHPFMPGNLAFLCSLAESLALTLLPAVIIPNTKYNHSNTWHFGVRHAAGNSPFAVLRILRSITP